MKQILTDREEQQAAPQAHEDSAERLYARGDNADADKQRELGRADRESARIAAERAQLSRERERGVRLPNRRRLPGRPIRTGSAPLQAAA